MRYEINQTDDLNLRPERLNLPNLLLYHEAQDETMRIPITPGIFNTTTHNNMMNDKI